MSQVEFETETECFLWIIKRFQENDSKTVGFYVFSNDEIFSEDQLQLSYTIMSYTELYAIVHILDLINVALCFSIIDNYCHFNSKSLKTNNTQLEK